MKNVLIKLQEYYDNLLSAEDSLRKKLSTETFEFFCMWSVDSLLIAEHKRFIVEAVLNTYKRIFKVDADLTTAPKTKEFTQYLSNQIERCQININNFDPLNTSTSEMSNFVKKCEYNANKELKQFLENLI